MKKFNDTGYRLITLIVIAACVVFTSCKKHEESAQDKTRKMLISGTWKNSTVTVDGINRNDLFTGFTLTFTPTAYSSVNGDPVWPASGTWTFTDGNAKAVKRDDGGIVDIVSVTEMNLKLSLQWDKTTLSGGKEKSIKGNHVFEFTH